MSFATDSGAPQPIVGRKEEAEIRGAVTTMKEAGKGKEGSVNLERMATVGVAFFTSMRTAMS